MLFYYCYNFHYPDDICEICFLNTLFIYFLGGEGREKEREKNINVWLPLVHPLLRTWPTTQVGALTGNQT